MIARGVALRRSGECPPDVRLALAHVRARVCGLVTVLVGQLDREAVSGAALVLDDPAGNDAIGIAALAGNRLVDASAFVFPAMAAFAVMGGFARRGALSRG